MACKEADECTDKNATTTCLLLLLLLCAASATARRPTPAATDAQPYESTLLQDYYRVRTAHVAPLEQRPVRSVTLRHQAAQRDEAGQLCSGHKKDRAYASKVFRVLGSGVTVFGGCCCCCCCCCKSTRGSAAG
jgi:hypothetical protein